MVAKLNDDLRIIAFENCMESAKKVNEYINKIRKTDYNYLVPIEQPRFGDTSGKVVIIDSVRDKDLFIISDCTNYSNTKKFHGVSYPLTMDDHVQDLRRVIGANRGHAGRITLVLPFLPYGRQHRRKGREPLECAIFLQEMVRLGVSNIVTFDIHDPGMTNAVPLTSFENAYPTDKLLVELLDNEKVDLKNLIIISPDGGAVERAMHYADRLRTNIGMFHKRRDLTKVVNGKAPVIEHRYIGESVEGKDVIVVDDMISSGGSVIEVVRELKHLGANKIYLSVSFALFVDGIEEFDKLYNEGLLTKLYTTNLSYIPEEIKNQKWIHIADLSKQMAEIINAFNMQSSLTSFLKGDEDAMERVRQFLDEK